MQNSDLQTFLAQFRFKPKLRGYIGIERERFLTDTHGRPIPAAEKFLETIKNPLWTYELSACQVEDRISPQKHVVDIERAMLVNDNEGTRIAEKIGVLLVTQEVGPPDMPLTVYPEPRYLAITQTLPETQLAAACRVAGTHIHVGVSDINEALRVYNTLRAHLGMLTELGDHSNGERLRLYRTMAPQADPPPYRTVEELYETARASGFLENPRNCWHLVRISAHGTVECRMFGATAFIDEIIHWVDVVRKLISREVTHA